MLSEVLQLVGVLLLLLLRIELGDRLESETIVAVMANVGEGRAPHHLVFVWTCLALVCVPPRLLVLDELRLIGRKLWCVVDFLGVVHVTKQRASGRVAVVELERTGWLWCLSPGAVGDILGSDDDSVIVLVVVVWMVGVVEDAHWLVLDDLLEIEVHDGLVGGGGARGRVVRVWCIGVKVQTIHDGGIKCFQEGLR